MRVGMAILSALASLVLTASAALADGTIDQSQALHTNGAEGTCGDERLAQIVNGGLTGGLDRVDLHIWRDDSNATTDLHVEIQTALLGYPTGIALASATVPLSNVGTDSRTSAFVTATFDPPAMVRAGQQYAIVVLESGLPCTQGYWWSFVDGLAYPGGDALSHSGGSWFYLWRQRPGLRVQDLRGHVLPTVDIPNVFPDSASTGSRRSGVHHMSVGSAGVRARRRHPPRRRLWLDDAYGPRRSPRDGAPHRVRVLVAPDVGSFVPETPPSTCSGCSTKCAATWRRRRRCRWSSSSHPRAACATSSKTPGSPPRTALPWRMRSPPRRPENGSTCSAPAWGTSRSIATSRCQGVTSRRIPPP